MKRLFLLLIIVVVTMGCALEPDAEYVYHVEFSGEYYIFVDNILEDGRLFVVVTWGENDSDFIVGDYLDSLGGSLGDMKISAHKVLGPTYPDGFMTTSLIEWHSEEVLMSDNAPLGDPEAELAYKF